MRLCRLAILLACVVPAAGCYLSHELAPPSAGGTAFSSGTHFACGVDAAGRVACWGDDGLGSAESRCDPRPGDAVGDCAPRPVEVPGTDGAIDVVIGTAHACALLAGGNVVCWGSNLYGNLGDGTTRDSATPVGVVGIHDAIALTAGAYYTCALRVTGEVSCWGQNVAGVLGDGHGVHGSLCFPLVFDCAPLPVAVVTDARFVLLRGGYTHACGVTADGALYCWGGNVAGEVGDGSRVPHYEPVLVAHGVRSVAAGSDFTCASYLDGSVSCWGAVPAGIPLEDHPSDCLPQRCITTPVPVATATVSACDTCPLMSVELTNVRSVSTGSGHVCALRNDGSMSCLGALPPVSFPPGVVDVETGSTSLDTCFRLGSGELYCWPSLRGSGDWSGALAPVALP